MAIFHTCTGQLMSAMTAALLIEYIVMDEKMRKWVREVRVVKGFMDISDQYSVQANLKMEMKWIRKNEEMVNWQMLKKEEHIRKIHK